MEAMAGPGGGPTPTPPPADPVIVFYKNGTEDNSIVYKQNMDGSGVATIISPADANCMDLAISFDQQKVAFIKDDSQLYVVGINHNGAALPTPLIDAPSGNVLECPAFSKDGTKVAFRWGSSTVPALSGIYIVDIATGSYAKIPGAPSTANHPSWSPEGTIIVYDNYSDHQIYTISSSVTGTDTPHRVDLAGNVSLPCWSPVDNQIAFRNSAGVALVTYQSSTVTQLTMDGSDWPGYWSPDGTKVIFGRNNEEDIFSVRISDKLETNITDTPDQGEYL